MDIGVPLRELGEYDVSPLCDVILAQGEEVWHMPNCQSTGNTMMPSQRRRAL